MIICPLKHQLCEKDCALYNTSKNECNVVAPLEHCLGEEELAAAVTYPSSGTKKDSHSDYWDNSTSRVKVWRSDDPILPSLQEHRNILREEIYGK